MRGRIEDPEERERCEREVMERFEGLGYQRPRGR